MRPRKGNCRLARGRYAIILLGGHKDSTDAAISLLVTLATFFRVPLQKWHPAALSNFQYVEPLPKEDHRSTTFHSSAVITLLQKHAVVLAPSASAFVAAVRMVKSAAPAPRVRILNLLLSSGS